MPYWLVKTESNVYSIDDLKRDQVTAWTGVRNYQARNYLRQMVVGDRVLVYHSNSAPSGVVGIAKVSRVASPDPSQFDPQSEYFDRAASKEKPRWFCPEIEFGCKFPEMVSLADLRDNPKLRELILLKRGSRLSVIPVSAEHFKVIESLGCGS